MAAKSRSNELHLTRSYDAPLEAVWEAWTDPKQVAKWWGPRGFTITTHSKDLRPGGTWRYTMHGPDGTDYPNVTWYLEVEKHRRLVYDHGGSDDRPPMFRVTVVFTATAGGTKMEMTMRLPTPEAAEEARKFIKRASGESTWDRLAEHLAKERAGKERFVINRAFDIPIERMFDLWTKPEHVARWLPPVGFEMRFLRAELKAGGASFYVMTGGEGVKLYGRAEYLELKRPGRLSYVQRFCDEHENPVRNPMSPSWPEKMLTVVTFEAEAPERTRVTVTWEPYETDAPDELQTFVDGRAGMTQGWTGSFDKLEAYAEQPSGN